MTTQTLAQTRSWRHRRLALAEHPNRYFWAIFLILNGLLFLPFYLVNLEASSFLPLSSNSPTAPATLLRELLVWRNNLDIFRLNAELILFTAVLMLVPWQRWPGWRRPAAWLYAITYFLALTYALYESLVSYLYQQEAVLYAQAMMLADGLHFLLRHLPLQVGRLIAGLFIAALIIFILLILVRAISVGIPQQKLSIFSKAALAVLALWSLLAIFQYRSNLASPKSVVSSLTAKLGRNASASHALYTQVNTLDELAYSDYYDYSAYDLLQTPDIYLIFVESYGSILYKEDPFLGDYANLLAVLEERLEEDGWHAASTLSESTSWGGGYWMAYTSLLFGLRIDNHPHYTSLFERYQDEAYPDLGYTLRTLGYEYVRATSLAAELPEEEWQDYVNFFGVDRWIRYRDLQYDGEHFGWGPSPPDQFVLNKLHEELNRSQNRPYFLFWVTQNSHYPWRTLPQIVDDWQALNDGSAVVTVFDEDETSLSSRQQNYMQAIDYELSFLTEFIVNEADDDALFVLIGDHQPGYVTRRTDGYDTPLHIISKDQELLQRFENVGFEKGLFVEDGKGTMRHEGFYSLFMRALLQQYGHGSSALPQYFAGGVQAEEIAP